MTESANGKRRSAGEGSSGDFPHSLPGIRTEVVLFDNSDQMVQSLGSHDEALRYIEEQFPDVNFHVRGNELSISGPTHDVPRIMRLLHEVRGLVARGTVISPTVLQQLVALLRTQSLQTPVDVLTHDILSSRGRTIRPKTLNQKNYVDAIDDNTVIFGIGPAGTGKTYLAMAKAVQALQQKEVTRIILTRPAVEAGERLGFLPGTLSDKIDPYLRPLYDALHDMMDPESIPRLMAAGTIEVAPLAYMRGRSIRPKTVNQKAYVDAIDTHTVIFGIGPAGTGKTYLAMAKAVQALQAKEVNRIILTRPAVEAGEKLGFLPGTLTDKIDPYLRPLYDALHDMVDPESIPRLIAAGTIEVAPLAYMRGRTLNDAFIILDEAQNTTPEQMKMFLTRLGFGSRIVVTGDVTQVDLPGATKSGLKVVTEILHGVEDIAFCRLDSSDVVRHRLVGDIVNAYEAWQARARTPRPRPARRSKAAPPAVRPQED